MAPWQAIDYDLLQCDSREVERLVKLCENQGFVYLSLPHSKHEALWQDVSSSFQTMKSVFDQPISEKMKVHLRLSGEDEIYGQGHPDGG